MRSLVLNKLTPLLILVLLLAFGPISHAIELNVAFVDGNVLFQKFQSQINEELQNEFSDKRDSMINLQKDLQQLNESATIDGAILSSAENQTIQHDIDKKSRELQRLSQAYQEEYALRGNEEMQKMEGTLLNVVNGIADKNHYDLVLQSAAILYANQNYDITPDVIKALDEPNS